jgi:hypothetical protein
LATEPAAEAFPDREYFTALEKAALEAMVQEYGQVEPQS